MSGRAWTESDLETLRREWKPGRGPTLARKLRRSPSGVYQAAKRLGLPRRPKIAPTAGFLASIRRLNGDGWPCTDIAGHLGCDRHTVSRHRKAMGLPSREKGERWRERIAHATALQCRREGVASLGALRSLVFRRRSAAAGWPPDLRPRHVDILRALAARPMTRRELADALGMTWLGSRASLKSNDPEGSYLAHLTGRGLVVTLGRVVRGEGRGRSVNLYGLALDAEPSHAAE